MGDEVVAEENAGIVTRRVTATMEIFSALTRSVRVASYAHAASLVRPFFFRTEACSLLTGFVPTRERPRDDRRNQKFR